MKKVIIFGDSQFSKVMYKTLNKDNEADVIAFTIHKKYLTTDEIYGVPVVPFEELRDRYDMCTVQILITIGYGKMNDIRKKIYQDCKENGYKLYTSISKYSMVYSDDIGEGTIISAGAYVGPNTKIGICNMVSINSYVSHDSKIGDFCFISGGCMFGGNVEMGDNCFIGMNCTIRNGISLAKRTFVGANSYINENTLESMGYIGNPAVNKNNLKSDLMIRFV